MPPADKVEEAEQYKDADATKVESSQKLLEEISKGGTNPYSYNQGDGGASAATEIDKFIKDKGLPEIKLVDEAADKISVRVLDATRNSERVQTVMPDGRVITQLPGGKTLEFDPKKPPAEQFTLSIPPSTKITDKANPELKNLIEKPLIDPPKTREQKVGDTTITTTAKVYADGHIEETYAYAPADKAKGQKTEAKFYPPGTRPDGLREEAKYAAGDGPTGEGKSERTVKNYDAADGKPARKETQFTSPDTVDPKIKVDKVIAYKTPPGGPDGVGVETTYRKDGAVGRGPDGAERRLSFPATDSKGRLEALVIPGSGPRAQEETQTRFRDGVRESTYKQLEPAQPTDKLSKLVLPGGVTQEKTVGGTVTTEFNPPKEFKIKVPGATPPEQTITGVTKVVFKDGKLTFTPPGPAPAEKPAGTTALDGKPLSAGNTARTGEVLLNGERVGAPVRPDAPVRPGDVTVNPETGLAEKMKIGDKEYKVTRSPDGQLKTISFGSPETTLTREGDKWVISGDKKPSGTPPVLDMDGLKLKVVDGKVVGDIQMNKKGEIYYKTDNGPHRVESIKKPDGTVVSVDFKNYERTEFKPPAMTASQPQFWDGYEWRNGRKTVTGDTTKIEFLPRPGESGFDPNKPSALERTSSPPSNDKAVVKFQAKDNEGKIVDVKTVSADWTAKKQIETEAGPPPKTKELYYDGNGYREGKLTGNTVEFTDNKDGQAVKAKYNADGTVETIYGKPPQEKTVLHDKNGYVSEVRENGKKTQFVRDADGDVRQQVIYGPDGKVKERWERKGPDKAPLMGATVGQEGNARVIGGRTAVGQPGRALPREIGTGSKDDLNTWVRVEKDGAPVSEADRAKPENQRRENVFVTADGAVVREKPPTKPGETKPEIEINDLARGTTETRNSGDTARTFTGPDGTKVEGTRVPSADATKPPEFKWKLPGQAGDGVVGTPTVLRDGQFVVKSVTDKPGSTTGEKITTMTAFDKDGSATLDDKLNPIARRGLDGKVTTIKWEGTPPKPTEVKGPDGKVTHKVERGALRPVEADGTVKPDAPEVTVTKEGKVLEKTTNPANGTIERNAAGIGVVRDDKGVPVRMEKGRPATETWDIATTKDPSTGEVTITKVTKAGTSPAETIAESGPGKGRLKLEDGKILQEGTPGSGRFDNVFAMDGTRRVDTATKRELTVPGKLKLAVDEVKLKPNDYTGNITELADPTKKWELTYDGSKDRNGDVFELKKVKPPGGPEIEFDKGDPKVTQIKLNERTGEIMVTRADNSKTIFMPGDATKYKTEFKPDGSFTSFDKAGNRTQMGRLEGGRVVGPIFQIKEAGGVVSEVTIPGSPAPTVLKAADGPLKVTDDGGIRQIPNSDKTKTVTRYPDGRTVTDSYDSDKDDAEMTGRTVTCRGRTMDFDVNGDGELVLKSVKTGDKAWTDLEPNPAKLIESGPHKGEVALTKAKLPDGTVIVKGPNDELFLSPDGSLVHKRQEVDKTQRTTTYNGDGVRFESVKTNIGTPNETATIVQVQRTPPSTDTVTGFLLGNTSTEMPDAIEAGKPLRPGGPVAAQFDDATGELKITLGTGPTARVFIVNSKGEQFEEKPKPGSTTEKQRVKLTPRPRR